MEGAELIKAECSQQGYVKKPLRTLTLELITKGRTVKKVQ
jgi:hypothetical protein